MNKNFADIILEGKIKAIKPTPEEKCEHNEHLELRASPSTSTAAITDACGN
jgi:hypothetical protein